MSNRTHPLPTPMMLLRAYAAGIFPMAESAQSEGLKWFDPPVRALIPLDNHFHIPKRLARTLRQKPYQVTFNQAFKKVIQSCGEPVPGRETTWINHEILQLYTNLHSQKYAHSIEVWQDKDLVGGLYGVSLGGAFFGESMFSRKTNASKIALVYLVALLRHTHFELLDTQFQTTHLERFGTFEIARSAYHLILEAALAKRVDTFPSNPDWDYLLAELLSLQPVTQIS